MYKPILKRSHLIVTTVVTHPFVCHEGFPPVFLHVHGQDPQVFQGFSDGQPIRGLFCRGTTHYRILSFQPFALLLARIFFDLVLLAVGVDLGFLTALAALSAFSDRPLLHAPARGRTRSRTGLLKKRRPCLPYIFDTFWKESESV